MADSKCPCGAIESKDVAGLLSFYSTYVPRLLFAEPSLTQIQGHVNALFARDYEFSIVKNVNGELCSTYPEEIIILERARGSHTPAANDAEKLRELFRESRFARVRGRFVVPVLLLGNKNICRSATTSVDAVTMLSNVHSKAKQLVTGYMSV